MKVSINLHKVEVHYGDKRALKGISLKIPNQRVTVLIGPSGCGKSTTLRCINGLVRPHKGVVEYRGQDIRQQDPTKLRREMGYAIQSAGLIPHMTVAQNVSLVPKLLGWDQSRRNRRSEELLELVGLSPGEFSHKYPSQLSGGEAQRCGVARALGADPPVLLMDEPFGAVDPINREILQDEFIAIQRKLKKTVVFVTHDLEEALRLADFLVIMQDGKIIQAQSPGEILAQPADDFVERFLGPDRALKRLILFTADQFLEEKLQCHWILDKKNRPVKGEAVVKGKKIIRSVDLRSQTVFPHCSLKESMARILSLGLPAVPVVDKDYSFMGEVSYETIQKISLQ